MQHETPSPWYYEYLDNIANLEFKNKVAQQGGTALRYSVARKQQGDKPLCGQVADLVLPRLSLGTTLLVTGTGNPEWLPHGETDGPSGIAVLARTLAAMGVRSCVLSEERFLPGVAASIQAGGTPLLAEDAWHKRTNGALALAFPTGAEGGSIFVKDLLGRLPEITAAFFVEKPGPNQLGIFHNSSGKPKSPDWVAHAHLLVNALRGRGVPTIGVGDGGNEIGFGRIREQLAPVHRLGVDCGCPCHGGLLDATVVDVLFPAAVSNWGAYAIAAALALKSHRPDSLPDWVDVQASVSAPIAHGAFDGYSGLALPTVDGTSLAANQSIYGLIREVIRLAGEQQ